MEIHIVYAVPIEHSCHCCAAPLTKVRALPEPIYGLVVVVCPECRAAVVRRKHPLAALWRSTLHARNTMIALASRGVLAWIMVLGTFACATAFAQSINLMRPSEFVAGLWSGQGDLAMKAWREDNGPLLLVVMIGWSVLMGTLLTAGLSHIRRRWTLWAMFAAALLIAFWIPKAIDFVDRALSMGPQGSIWSGAFRLNIRDINTLITLAGMMCLAALGIPAGLRLRKALAGTPARRFRKMLARARIRKLSP